MATISAIHEDDILASLAEQINRAARAGTIGPSWITDGYWNQGRWLHAMIWGMLVRAVPTYLHPLVEPSTSGFKQDIVLLDSAHRKLAVIEFESSNSSDERLVDKDISHFENLFVDGACRPVLTGMLL